MEFAYDLLCDDGTHARTTRLVDIIRTIIVPVANPAPKQPLTRRYSRTEWWYAELE